MDIDVTAMSNSELQELISDIAEEMKDRGFEEDGRKIQTISRCLD